MVDGVSVLVPPQVVIPKVATIVVLRATDSDDNLNGDPIIVREDESLFLWNALSLAADDGISVIRPDDRTPLQLGRWINQSPYIAFAVPTGASLIGFLQAGTGAVARTVQAKLREVVSVTDFGAVEGLDVNNTAAFQAAFDSLPYGGVVEIPYVGDWRADVVMDRSDITLRGRGGVGDLTGQDVSAPNRFPCLRPWTTGAGTATVRTGNPVLDQEARRIKIENICISGDDGSGNMADAALYIGAGTANLETKSVDLAGGIKTLWIQPGDGVTDGPAAFGLKLYGLFIRNDLADANSRAIYIRKFADAKGYVTDLHIEAKVNRTPSSLGYWFEADGTGSTGLVVHLHRSYVDHAPGNGMLLHGMETIECFGGLQLDPGALATVVVKQLANVGDPSRYIRGFIEGIGGQKLEYGPSNTQVTFSSETGLISYESLLRRPQMLEQGYFNADPADPFTATMTWDFQGPAGPMRWDGVPVRWLDATDATSPTTGAVGTEGGISAEKSIYAGSGVHSDVGFFFGNAQVVGPRGAAVTAPTGGATQDAEARTAINSLIARLQAHGLIS